MDRIVDLDALLQVWRTNCAINRKILGAIDQDGLAASLSTRGGRTVARQFAHLHDIRLYHLQKRAPPLARGSAAFARKGAPKSEPSRTALLRAFDDSDARIAEWFVALHEGRKGIRAFRRGPTQHVAYFVAHESHHRGSILLTLKQCGHPVPKAVRDGIWDWDRL
jgi:uncharacterized damage-inducible protein DinB